MEGPRPGAPPLPFLNDVPGVDEGDDDTDDAEYESEGDESDDSMEWEEDDAAAEEATEMLWPVAGESHR